MNNRAPVPLPDGWRWSPHRRRGGPFTAVVLGLLLVLSAGVARSDYDRTAGNFGTSLQASVTGGSSFTEWNSTRNILRTEIKLAIGVPLAVKPANPTGRGIDVAVIDTGVAPVKYLDSADAVINGPDLSLDRQLGLPTAVDAYGHGTHLAGIIAGRDAGVAPGSRIVNLKVGAADGAVDVSQVIAAIDWVVTHRADPGFNIRVINLAYGTDGTQSYLDSPLTHAVESAWRAGIVVVVAAGNSGGALAMPATDPFVVTVGAADLNDPRQTADDVVAPYSAVGTTARGVDLLAPGTSITSLRVPGGYVDTTYPESRFNFAGTTYAKGSGTSQAAAVVSGAVALLLEAHPEMTPDQVKAMLKSTARPLAGTSANAQGAGVIDVGKALAAKVPAAGTARQRWKVSTGRGPIEAARGDAHLVADDGTVLSGEVDLLGQPWNGSVWAPLSTAGAAWAGGTWNGNVWTGTGFETSLTVDGVAWTGRTWRSATWTGRTWRADVWTGHTWYGRTWRSDGWA
ncbi:MAG: S8 family serine peptidase [Acidimicrobiales bacterium]